MRQHPGRAPEYSTLGDFTTVEGPSFSSARSFLFDPVTVIRRLAELEKVPELRGEALTRRGWRLLADGQPADALRALEAARAAGSEPYVRYLSELFNGWTLDALKRKGEAEAAYR